MSSLQWVIGRYVAQCALGFTAFLFRERAGCLPGASPKLQHSISRVARDGPSRRPADGGRQAEIARGALARCYHEGSRADVGADMGDSQFQ